jgi:hypothetical protein
MTTTTDIGAAASIDFVVGWLAQQDDNPLPVSRPEGGTKLDDTYPDGAGKPSEDAPILPSRQPVNIPADFPRKRK